MMFAAKNDRRSQRPTLAACLIGTAVTVSSVGCAGLTARDPQLGIASKTAAEPGGSLLDKLPWNRGDQPPEPYPNPSKMAATWVPDTLMQTGRTPTRGFGGRIFFYDEKSKAVPVEGTLVVHGFDETASNPEDAVKRFEFTPEQFTRRFSQSDFGASYSVWVPWDAVGGEQKRISLVATFRSASGKIVQGSPTVVPLPGQKPNDAERLAKKLSPAYERWQLASAGETTRTSMATTTIPLRQKSQDDPRNAHGDGGIGGRDSMYGRPLIASGAATPSLQLPLRRQESTAVPGSSATESEHVAERPIRQPLQVRPATTRLPVQR